MFQKLSLVALSFLILVLSALSGCGSSSPTGTTGGGNGGGGGTTFGTIALSGSGTVITGTSFTAMWHIGTQQWANVSSPGMTYPHDIAVIMPAAIGSTTIGLVEVIHAISATSTSAQWAAFYPASTAVSMGSTTVTFNNLTLLGYASTTNTSLTLNGTLSY